MAFPGVTADLITVGFDGSKPSLAALRWAVDAAQAASSTIQVVTSYQPKNGESIDVARMRAEETVNLATGPDNVEIVRRAIPGEPTEVLLACSDNSRLLVVGRHGTSGMIHSALGSVPDACVRLSACPVVIVPPDLATPGPTR